MQRLKLLPLCFLLFACGKPLPELKDIDLEQWQKDKNACGTYRSSVISAMDQQKEKLLALDENQVVDLLGRPDRNELYKRNQKFFYYYLNPTVECHGNADSSKKLTIRFNAMGLAKEVMIE